ncbi:hypothetical protein [Desulfonema magnum]|uniref:Uncharacterized protein n=1 Tax=Desulfonema magnum TaxID=45655 RepID=A0A975BWU0_9BACT|nr:hypothetical protein [Desulfonema magnum]QTA92972.1 Uncharacterized protein dnm_090650 [Desulfonema magnum]
MKNCSSVAGYPDTSDFFSFIRQLPNLSADIVGEVDCYLHVILLSLEHFEVIIIISTQYLRCWLPRRGRGCRDALIPKLNADFAGGEHKGQLFSVMQCFQYSGRAVLRFGVEANQSHGG